VPPLALFMGMSRCAAGIGLTHPESRDTLLWSMDADSTFEDDAAEVSRGALTEDEARAMLERIRWPSGIACVHCGKQEIYRIETKASVRKDGRPVPARHLYKCKTCRKQFSITKGTIFEDSKIPLSTWITVMYRMCSSRGGLSAQQVSREFGVTHEAARFMCQRIRSAVSETEATPLPEGVEPEEAHSGYESPGAFRRRAVRLDMARRMRQTKKAPVIAKRERLGQRVRRIAALAYVLAVGAFVGHELVALLADVL
jgi:transposase-like protein